MKKIVNKRGEADILEYEQMVELRVHSRNQHIAPFPSLKQDIKEILDRDLRRLAEYCIKREF